MPIYEYHCEKCQTDHEIIQKFSDPPNAECPQCKAAMKRKVSRSAFHLKGSGWYATDYKKPQSSQKDSGDGGSAKTEPATPKKGSDT